MRASAAGQSALREATPGSAWMAGWWHRAPSLRFRAFLFGFVVFVLVTGLRRHAMWLDEVQAWLIVRDSHSLADIARNLRYEGHPALWYLFLVPFRLLGRQPEWMQCAQAVCAIGSAALIVWRGPFSRLELALLPFTYSLLFEYGVKSRSYALGNLLLLAFCALWPRRRTQPLVLAAVLALMANVHALFAILAAVALVTMLIDQATQSSLAALPTRANALCCAIVLLGLFAAAATALPPPDSGFAIGWRTDLSWVHVTHTFKALAAFTVERPSVRASILPGLFGIVLVGIGVSRFRRLPAATFLLGAGTLGMVAFFHLKGLENLWHHSLLFMVLVAAVWIGRLGDAAHPTLVTHPADRTRDLLPRSLFAAVLGLQVMYGVPLYARDAVRPYSNGRAIARFIERHGWTNAPTFAFDDYGAVSALGYLGVDRFYYAQGARWGSFIVFDDQRLKPIDEAAFFALVERTEPAPTILDCELHEPLATPAAHGYIAVAKMGDSTTGENCTIYRRPP